MKGNANEHKSNCTGQKLRQSGYSLMTCAIVTQSDRLGAYAASILLRKLSHRENTCCTIYLKTTLLFRETAP